MTQAKVLMVQGTSSCVGKSSLVTAICSIYAKRGIKVAPFKAQNMSNNSAVCKDGSEIGRSQFVQATAAEVEPTADMNPLLLKPEGQSRCQVIVHGRLWKSLDFSGYRAARDELWPCVTASLDRLRNAYDLVIVEGCGSSAEMNVYDDDLSNMAVAEYANCSVILVGDIEKGGIFAQLLGTLWLVKASARPLIRGFIVNKYRGDPTHFVDGAEYLERKSGLPVLGIVPWMNEMDLPAEDAQSLDQDGRGAAIAGGVDLVVIRLPTIANFDDFDALRREPTVNPRFANSVSELGNPDAIILPGSKNTNVDLQWLRTSGIADRILALHQAGVRIVGICGGYQMMGETIQELTSDGSDSPIQKGLGLFPIHTDFHLYKETHQVRATVVDDRHCQGALGTMLSGYEVHLGQTTSYRPWLSLRRSDNPADVNLEGSVTPDGRAWGCYVHGVFEDDRFRLAWLNSLAKTKAGASSAQNDEISRGWSQSIRPINAWRRHIEQVVDIRALDRILGY